MPLVTLASETDLEGWRRAARRLRLEGVSPDAVDWRVMGLSGDLFETPGAVPQPQRSDGEAAFSVPRAFMDLARLVVLHRAPDRFGLLYRTLWRLQAEPGLLDIASDADIGRLHAYGRGVSRAAHKMKAFLRFRRVPGQDEETYAAWFEPAHRVTAYVAPFFVRRFTNMRFSILTPDVCVHWDMRELAYSPGARASDAPPDDELEDFWRTYYAAIFNPARLKPQAMQREMPKRYWRNLPEASLIAGLVQSAEGRVAAMVQSPPTEPARRIAPRPAPRAGHDLRGDVKGAQAAQEGGRPASLDEVSGALQACRRCDLWRGATQAVPGEGAGAASLMFVGEQPGDQEDLAGRPFVGPAGGLFMRGLEKAGLPREEAYVTNAVKHFKHEVRGRRRLHRTPDPGEVRACRWWLQSEIDLVRPRLVVALGATAAYAVLGREAAIRRERGRPLDLEGGRQALITYHPAYMLRLPNADAREAAFMQFVEDLRMAGRLAGLAA